MSVITCIYRLHNDSIACDIPVIIVQEHTVSVYKVSSDSNIIVFELWRNVGIYLTEDIKEAIKGKF